MRFGTDARTTAQAPFVDMGDLLWRLHPNGGRVAGVSVPCADAERLLDRGWLKVNGERALIMAVEENEPIPSRVRLRILFDKPYPDSHP